MSATGGGNPAAGDGNPGPGGQESPMGVAGTWVVSDSGPHGGDGDVIGAAGVAGAAGGLGQEEGGQAADQAMARALESGSSEEDSDIGPADEGEENMSGHRNLVMDARQFPMVGFRFIFLDLVHSLLYRIYYNHHILVRPRGGRVGMHVGPRMAQGAAQLPALPSWEGPGENAVAQEREGPGEGATAQEPEDQPEAEAEAKEEPAQEAAAWEETTKYQHENSEEEAQDAESKEGKTEFNKKQEGPEKDVDPAENGPGNLSWKE
ncbi:cancer/testis antigen family 47 member A11 [Rhinolophus ferrumequinum]|uniref:cancer/testis antigen family 47 member A11 n=1 Tax=Rhinolophus ferrumequinum TaxID=59479 RepID=UPI00140F8764|nr:cancer/testis antigen family 47 member A11 [Rhinolophus ferrumequinum]